MYRHGDVNLLPTKLPKEAKKIEFTHRLTIAYGETTGHNHTLVAERNTQFEVYDLNGTRYFVFEQPVEIQHPEHKPLTILPGVYVQGQEKEKDWFSLTVRKVID